MTIKHVQQNGNVRVRINRGDTRRVPYLSDVVQGTARQETPNGVSTGFVVGSDPLRTYPGSRSGLPQSEPIPDWVIGDRSGE